MCALSAKEIGYLKDHFIESVTEIGVTFDSHHGPSSGSLSSAEVQAFVISIRCAKCTVEFEVDRINYLTEKQTEKETN